MHGFWQKFDLLLICFVLSKQSKKLTYFDILDSKECFFDLKSEVLKNSKKWTFCQGVNRPFSHLFFSRKKWHKQTFFDILDRKECFLDLKSEVLKNSKKSTFSKGVSPWFLAKIRPSSYMFFFEQTKQETNIF